MNHARFLTSLLLSILLMGCGSAEPQGPTIVRGDDATATVGGETPPEPDPVPTGPAPSFMGANHTVVMRLDMTRVRASAISDDIAGLVRSYPTWQELLGNSGIEPVRDFERVLVSAPGGMAGESVMVLRHNMTEARVREAVLSMAVEGAAPPAWRQEDGFDVVDWPAQTEVPRVVVISAEHELIVATPGELARILEVAADHRLRRGANADAIIEPQLQLPTGTIVTVSATEVSSSVASRLPHPPQAFALEVTDDQAEEGRMQLDAQADYADAAAAEAARSWVAGQRDQYAGHMMVRAVGLDRVLREAEIGAEGTQVQLGASFTEEELQRVIGLLALLQIGG
ncbi:MAG: hypothetical protein AB8I08_22305 [Sandaracinaceae bacterium]